MENVDIISSFFPSCHDKISYAHYTRNVKKVRQSIVKISFMYNKINDMFPFIERNGYHVAMSSV